MQVGKRVKTEGEKEIKEIVKKDFAASEGDRKIERKSKKERRKQICIGCGQKNKFRRTRIKIFQSTKSKLRCCMCIRGICIV